MDTVAAANEDDAVPVKVSVAVHEIDAACRFAATVPVKDSRADTAAVADVSDAAAVPVKVSVPVAVDVAFDRAADIVPVTGDMTSPDAERAAAPSGDESVPVNVSAAAAASVDAPSVDASVPENFSAPEDARVDAASVLDNVPDIDSVPTAARVAFDSVDASVPDTGGGPPPPPTARSRDIHLSVRGDLSPVYGDRGHPSPSCGNSDGGDNESFVLVEDERMLAISDFMLEQDGPGGDDLPVE